MSHKAEKVGANIVFSELLNKERCFLLNCGTAKVDLMGTDVGIDSDVLHRQIRWNTVPRTPDQ